MATSSESSRSSNNSNIGVDDNNNACACFRRRPKDKLRRHSVVLRRYPYIAIVPLFVTVAFFGAGVALIMTFTKSSEAEVRAEARLLAVRTGQWFSDQLDRAVMPLFSLSQFVHEIELFQDLPDDIGPAYQPGSLPFVDGDNDDALHTHTHAHLHTHRNVSSVCTRPELVQKFNDISASIKESAKMEGVLVNLQLAPEAVVCLSYPLNNTEDFEDGIFMDNTGAIGHDLLTDPARSFIAKATIPSEDVVIAGPLPLRQCDDCHPTVEQAFIARLPIVSRGSHTIDVDGISYRRWGFAVALINWNKLIERSHVFGDYEDMGMEFRLTRTDHIDTNTTTRHGEAVFEEKVLCMIFVEQRTASPCVPHSREVCSLFSFPLSL